MITKPDFSELKTLVQNPGIMLSLNQIRNLIGEGKVKEAISELLKILESSGRRTQSFRDDAIIIKSKYQDLSRKESLGLMNTENLLREKAQINDSLLHLIGSVETGVDTSSEKAERPPTKKWWWLLLLIIPVGLVILFAGEFDGCDPPPQKVLSVSFSANKTSCEAPCTVRFTNNSRNADRYVWRVNNTRVGTSRDLTHKFKNPGNYSVRLTGYQGNKSKTRQKTVTIKKPPKLKVDFRASKTACGAPCTIKFTNLSKNADRFVWKLNGIKTVGTGKDLSMTFEEVGTHTIRLTAYRGKEYKYKEETIQILVVMKPIK